MVERSEVVSLNIHSFFHSAKKFPPYPEKWNGVVYPKSLQEEKEVSNLGLCCTLSPSLIAGTAIESHLALVALFAGEKRNFGSIFSPISRL